VCQGSLHVVRLQCAHCATAIEGRFSLGWLEGLSPEHLQFIQVFLRCRGKIKDVEQELGLSYPTVVSRLNDVVAALGYEAPPHEPPPDRRRQVLDDLAAGRISAAEATQRLKQL